MAKKEKPRSGFVIKLSDETALKLAEEENPAKSRNVENLITSTVPDGQCQNVNKIRIDTEETHSTETRKEDSVEDNTVAVCKEKCEEINSSNSKETGSVTSESKSTESIADSSTAAWGEYAPYITYEGEEAIYTDPTNKQKYTWSQTTNSWTAKADTVAGREYSYEDDMHIYTESDGSKFFWDAEKKAWIPKVDDDFLAFYQMSYGFVDNKAEDKKEDATSKEAQKKLDATTGVKRKTEPQWFEPSTETNTKVYVSNLPLELTEEEFVNFMQKCGLVERDPHSQKMRVKLYMDKERNCFKGDALCTYIKIESVDLALKLLDGSDFKGNKIKVERAHFQLKGEYNPALKPKKKKKKELEKIKKMQQKLFDWRPEKFVGERSKHERVVIVKNLFHPNDFDKDVQLILDYQQDLREECGKSGEVRKVVIYDRHPEGVAQITMKEPEQADAAVQLINGRWFGKRQITAEIWDGRTKYRIAETDADINKRIDKWDKFLEGKEDDKNKDNVSKSPMVEADKSNEPIVEADKSNEPMVEADKSNEPMVEADKSNEPMVEADKSIEPMVETDKSNEPSVEAEKSNEPMVEDY